MNNFDIIYFSEQKVVCIDFNTIVRKNGQYWSINRTEYNAEKEGRKQVAAQ